ncbi:hypothetical protein [Coleofasciculus sp. H7-2]|uniref:hypothetical protein n=1 Tax=Coleofasciculus sp. H7-2 TaxID=3351545 RepID=UPI00366C4F5C
MHFLRRYAVILPAIAAVSFLSVSCSDSKITQCQKIFQITNETVNETKTVTNGGKNSSPEALVKTADIWDKSAQGMTNIRVNDAKLKKFQADFIRMYRDSSKATREYVAALKKRDFPAVDAGFKKLQKAYSPEKDLVNAINSYCSGK